LILEDGLKPRIGSVLFARFSSISDMGLIIMSHGSMLLYMLRDKYIYSSRHIRQM
jgi:hypothetical protein